MEPQTFEYETYQDENLFFEITENGITYRLGEKNICAEWPQIQSIEANRFSNTLDIQVKGDDPVIKVPFGIDDFLTLVRKLTHGFILKNKAALGRAPAEFSVSPIFYLLMGVFLFAPLVLILAYAFNYDNLAHLDTMPKMVALFIPVLLVGYGVCIPVRACLKADCLLVRGLVRKTTIPYSNIKRIDVDLKEAGKRGKLLTVVIHKTKGRSIKIKWITDLILFYMVARSRLETHHAKPSR